LFADEKRRRIESSRPLSNAPIEIHFRSGVPCRFAVVSSPIDLDPRTAAGHDGFVFFSLFLDGYFVLIADEDGTRRVKCKVTSQ